MDKPDGGLTCVAVIGLALGALGLLAQLRLFRISDAMDQVLREVKLLRLQQYYAAGHVTEEDFRRRAQEIIDRR